MAEAGHCATFPTTNWSCVLAAGDGSSPGARAALAELCAAYWYPIYALIRRQGRTQDEASDLTQAYFTRLLEKPVIAAADPSRGRFRAFLRTDCRHFLLDHYRKRRVRANVSNAVSIDTELAERRYRLEPVDNLTPDREFDRTWAVALLERVLDLLEQEYSARGRGEVFERLKPALTQGRGAVPVAELAAQFGTSEGVVHTTVYRMKKSFRVLLRREIAATLEDPSGVEEEIRWLFEIMRS